MKTPEYLNKWTRPSCYVGTEWEGYYVFLGKNRDSDALTRANFDAGLKAVGGEQGDADENPDRPLVVVVRENHWAVGWVEWIAIHETAGEQLAIADGIMERLESYPVVSEELWSQYESEEADEVWRNCYTPAERAEYIREHRTQFEFRSIGDVLGCVRGKYFSGYAADLLH